MYKKSDILPKLRRSLENAQCLGTAIREAGFKSYTTLERWRKRPMIDGYIKKCMERSDKRRVDAVTDSLMKQALAGNMTACIFFLKNKAGWKDVLEHSGTVEHNHFYKEILAKPPISRLESYASN